MSRRAIVAALRRAMGQGAKRAAPATKQWRQTDNATGTLTSTDSAVSRLEAARRINGKSKADFIAHVRMNEDLYDQSDAYVLNYAGKNGMIRSVE